MASNIPEDELEVMETVPQSVLKEYFRLQNRFEFIKESIKISLEKGADVERGDITAKLVTSNRKNIQWKKIATDAIGEEKAKEISDNAPTTESTSLRVDISKQAVIGKEELT